MKDIRNALRTAVQNLEGMREGWYAQHDTKMDNNTLITAVALVQGGSNMTGTDLCVNKPQCAAAVRP